MKESELDPGAVYLPAIPVQVLEVLCWIVPRLERVRPRWVLTGSLALRL
jgi:hypothetical protein